MHTAKPPKELIEEWLEEYLSTEGRYGHILLEQKKHWDGEVRDGLKPYFESAHSDARDYFHAYASISLHPDDHDSRCTARYPNSLPPKARSGLFGEVMCGLATESFDFIGEHEWVVPVFLFRDHDDARQYLYQLARAPERKREVMGRTGDDFIALVVNDDGEVTRFLAGEAKCRGTWNPSTLKRVMLGEPMPDPNNPANTVPNGRGVWFELNRAQIAPIGLRQLQEILQEIAPDEYADVILSLDSILQLQNPDPIKRTDLILLIGGSAAGRKPKVPLLPWKAPPAEYKAGRDLQVVEILFEDSSRLIGALYDGLWEEVGDAGE